jgi:hypothetical protein
MELSTTCTLYFQELGARPTAQKNAPNKKLPSPPQTTQIPAEEIAPNKQPLSPPTAPAPTQVNAPNKQPSLSGVKRTLAEGALISDYDQSGHPGASRF